MHRALQHTWKKLHGKVAFFFEQEGKQSTPSGSVSILISVSTGCTGGYSEWIPSGSKEYFFISEFSFVNGIFFHRSSLS
jgi:hypothetical protein